MKTKEQTFFIGKGLANLLAITGIVLSLSSSPEYISGDSKVIAYQCRVARLIESEYHMGD